MNGAWGSIDRFKVSFATYKDKVRHNVQHIDPIIVDLRQAGNGYYMGALYTVFQKTCYHLFDDKLNLNCPFKKIFATLITKTIGRRQVFLFSHLTYFVPLLYLGNLSRPDISQN